MDEYQRQQFDLLLLTSADRLAERIVQRCAGAEAGLERLRADPNGPDIWLSDFVDAVFAEFCLDDADGAAFILRATAKRQLPVSPPPGTVADMLGAMARQVFTDLLTRKVVEALERSIRFG